MKDFSLVAHKILIFVSLIQFGTAEDNPTGSYSVKESGFYLSHFDRSPDPVGFVGLFRGNLIRGGRPLVESSRSWLSKLKDNRVELVIDVRSEALGLKSEREALVSQGISYVLLPWKTSGTDQPALLKVVQYLFTSEGLHHSEENLERVSASLKVLGIAREYLDQGRRIFVHCQRGEDRSGIFISLLRDHQDQWTSEFSRYGGHLYASLKKHREDLRSAMEIVEP